MGVLLQGFFKQQGGRAVPSPADGHSRIPWWWDHLAAQARDLATAGFTAIWLPPVIKSASGAGPQADGYGPFDDYDVGSRNQKGSIPTRFGNREQLQRCVAILRANGLDVYLDMVEHHRIGDTTPFVFRYPGAEGTPGAGRFPKDPTNFLPQVPRDPKLGGPVADDFPFGRELAPINARPARYVFDNLIAAADWLTRALDVQGYRLDDVKGLSTDFLLPFLDSGAMAGKFAVGEFFDGNPALVKQWIFNPRGMAGRPSAFDFPLKFMLTAMCNNPGRFNMADLDHAGLVGIAPFNAVTFVENHDTDLNPGQRIAGNKMLAYAYILTSEGYPAVFYKDYSADTGCYGLYPAIDDLIWIHEILAAGETLQRWKGFDVFAYERMGGPRLLVALNNDPDDAHTIRVDTGFGANVWLHDYSGHAQGDIQTDGMGAVTLTVPRNRDGLGYVCFSRQGLERTLDAASHAVTQVFEGAADLDIPPCADGRPVSIGRIWCAAGSPIEAVPQIDRAGWGANSRADFELFGPDGTKRAAARVEPTGPFVPLEATADADGFYTLQVTGSGLPAPNPTAPYQLAVRYTAPQAFDPDIPAMAPRSEVGQWSDRFNLDNVPVHAHLLPTGQILYWGRRKEFWSTDFATLNDHSCQTYILDPRNGDSRETANAPALQDGTPVNLFCSGHAFLPDGRLMVFGGHLYDSQGVNQSCIFDPKTERWTAEALMNEGRWYPSAIVLPDGDALVLSGSYATGPLQPPINQSGTNTTPQIWRGTGYQSLATHDDGLTLFPRLHIEPKQGHVFMSGAQGQSYFLDPDGRGTWIAGPWRGLGFRDYAPATVYETGKVIVMGGGNDQGSDRPTFGAETIDLNATTPAWHATSPMHFRRRQHNATVLADGTILVTGGTQGPGFNDLGIGAPIRAAELWDPETGTWTIMAEEAVDRCYHATALLLPDGRVFSGGGGEYAPEQGVTNDPKDTHANAQWFSPPYLFRGPRPEFSGVPDTLSYGQRLDLQVPRAAEIARVNWIRLASVTHSFDQNQGLNRLDFVRGEGKITITMPAEAKLCPPGHHMLFLVDDKGVPSMGHIARLDLGDTAKPGGLRAATFDAPGPSLADIDAETVRTATRPVVTVGITPTCPYGLAGCWGGAKGALRRLSGVKTVLELADAFTSTASVYLQDDRLPDLDLWRREFAQMANASYTIRGIEATLAGSVELVGGQLRLRASVDRPAVRLAPLVVANKVQWDFATRAPLPLSEDEASAYERLHRAVSERGATVDASITGTILKDGDGFYLEVRAFTL